MEKNVISKAYDILKTYKGKNNQILYLKRLNELGKLILTEDGFNTEYIVKNADYQTETINKIVKIASAFGEKLKNKYSLDFTPEKIKITTIIGEMGNSYHCYAQFRKSVDPQLMYINKRQILTPLHVVDHEAIEIDFTPYNEKYARFDRQLKEHQKTGVKFLVANKKCILADSMGLGKLEPISAKIPTPNGYKLMGDIKPGDKVFGSDGKPCDVLEVFPHKNKEIYEVSFSDGTKCECGLEHLWIVRTANNVRRNQGWQVKSLADMIKTGFEWSNGQSTYHAYKYEIPVTEPVIYEEKKHYIHPYILGMCIGDGNVCNHTINISIPDFEMESVDNISKLLHENYYLSEDRSTNCPRYRIIQKIRKQKNDYTQEINRLGLNVHGNYKFIPDEYKFDSIENRIELLKGLMDSDGCIRGGNKMSYYTNSEKLANDVAELVFSLGGIARLHHYDRVKNGINKREYHVVIQTKFNPFKLSRKANKYKPTFKKYCIKKITGAKYLRNEDAQCIKVNSFNNSYLTSDRYIVTHNTTTATVAALAAGCKKILVITTASLKSTWKREISYFEDQSEIVTVSGTKWDEETGKFTVINYDIVQNYYEIPYENEYKTEIIYGKNGETQELKVPVMIKDKKTGQMVNKKVKSRKKKDIKKALENSPLFTSNFDCVIIDEAQKLSNNDSNRYKVISDFLTKSRIEHVFLVTGTPLTNTPMNLYHILRLINADVTKDYEYYVNTYCAGKTMFKPGEWKKWLSVYERMNGVYWDTMVPQTKALAYEFISEHAQKITIPQGYSNLDELREKIKHVYIRRLSSDIPGMVSKHIDTRYYDLNKEQKEAYDKLWDEYVAAQEMNGDNTNEEYRQLVEGSLVRQFLAKEMIENTISLADDYIEDGEKVIIVCNFTSEINAFKEYYGDKAVVYDGKMSTKQKDKSEKEFMENPKIKVFIGQELAMSVGLTLTSSHIMIFNSYSWSENDNRQTQDRIYRITQKEDALCIYQLFTDSISQDMFEKVLRKGLIMDETIKAEKDK